MFFIQKGFEEFSCLTHDALLFICDLSIFLSLSEIHFCHL